MIVRFGRMVPAVAMAALLMETGSTPAPNRAGLLPAAWAQSAAVVTRGPYLQIGTPQSVIVRWRTDVATNSRVVYGSSPTTMTQSVNDSASTREHEVKISGLTPGTRYYYAVGTSIALLAGSGSGFPFTTSPPVGSGGPTRIWVLGDSGTDDSGQRSVRDAFKSFSPGGRTDLWLMLGDNAYDDGTDSEYQSAVFNMYPETLRTSVLWPTLGNHDGHTADSGTQSGPYYSIFTLPKNGEAGGLPSGTEAYYSFDYANIHFICLDSYDTSRSTSGAMLTWLREDLEATNQTWIIAFWHHPPYTKGSHDSDDEDELIDMRENALPILEQGGVDLVLTGHSHSYERSYLLDGHYGSSSGLTSAMKLDGGNGREDGTGAYEKRSAGPAPHEGAVYIVNGASGHTSGGSLDHPAMVVSLNVLGSVVLDVSGGRLDAKYIGSTPTVRDHFTILKGPGGPPVLPPPAPSQLLATATSTTQINLTWRDNASNETGFKIERCTGSTCSTFAQVGTAPANATQHADLGLGASTTYRYRVVAYNGGGNSAFSNVASAATFQPPPSGPALFEDDFESSSTDAWSVSNGTWGMVSDGSQVYRQSSTSGDSIASAGEPGWRNYRVEARVKPMTFNAAGGFVRLIGGFQNASNYYYVVLRSSNVLELRKLVAGTPTLLASKPFTVTPGTWYTVGLEIAGSNLMAYVNGNRELSANDGRCIGGTIAVGMFNASGAFDDVMVRAVEGSIAEDSDEDGFDDGCDNCPGLTNASQQDADQDRIGDVCEDPRVNANVDDSGSSESRIDGSDYFRLARAFGSRPGDLPYDPRVDFNRDLRIDGGDLALLAVIWAEQVPR